MLFNKYPNGILFDEHKSCMRNNIMDMMKGIGIIAVIIGHCTIPQILKNFIFTWHMPLFFVISGFFYKEISIKDSLLKNSRTLLLPYFLTSVIMLSLCAVKSLLYGKSDIINSFWGIFVGAGSHGLPFFSQYFVGAIWFLLALFWCRITYNLLIVLWRNDFKYIVIVTIAVLTTYLGTRMYIPTNLLQGLSAMSFFLIGQLFKKFQIFEIHANTPIIMLGLLCLTVTLLIDSNHYPLSMARCYYNYYPLNILSACFCIYFLFRFLKSYTDSHISIFLSYVGRISLLILCFHNIEFNYSLINIVVNKDIPTIFLIAYRLCIPIVMAWVFSNFAIVKKLFNIR